MINIDSEKSDEICVSSVAGLVYEIKNNYNQETPKYKKAYEVEIKGCKGGHSGLDIHYGRANAIVELAKILKDSKSNYEIESFVGGTAKNAIPTSAKAIIITNDDVEKELNDLFNVEKEKYKETDPDSSFSVKEVDIPNKVINETDSKKIIDLVSNFVDGVYTWLKDVENLPESSSNLGVINCRNGGLEIRIYSRSSDNDKLYEIDNLHKTNAKNHDIDDVTVEQTARAWKYNPNSKLLDIAKKSYKEVLGREAGIDAAHAGLECGTFAEYNPDMEMISIGPDIDSPHTIRETLTLSSIKIVWDALEKILNCIGK